MGAALESLGDKGDREPTAIRWQQQTPLKNLFYALYMISKNLKSSSTWFNPCFSPRRVFLLLYVESVYLLLSISEANTCVNFVCNNFYMLTYCTCYITLCWQYPWDMHVESWKQLLKLKSSYVLLQCLYLESIALWVNSYAKLFHTCLESTIYEKLLLIWFSVYSLSIC